MKITGMLLLLVALAGCHQPDYPDPPEFSAYEKNPVLVPGDSAEWDNLSVQLPYVVIQEGTFYLFYTGFNADGPAAVGLATSTDGYTFTKMPENPVFSADGTGFDAYGLGAQVIVKEDSLWVMYYNSSDIAGYGPGPYIGRATSTSLTGPWVRRDQPVLTKGNSDEWDSYFVIPTSVIIAEDGTRMMFYSGGRGFDGSNFSSAGLATSKDGISWKKYNDPSTTRHPYAESDPVMMAGEKGEWDDCEIWTCFAIKVNTHFEAYYSGGSTDDDKGQCLSIGHAVSKDGIHWTKFHGNPLLRLEDDPLDRIDNGVLEFPCFFEHDGIYFLYYDYGSLIGEIGVATGRR